MDRGQISNNDGTFKSVSVGQNVYVRNKITTHCINGVVGHFEHVKTDSSVTFAGDLFVQGDTTLMGDLLVVGDTTLAQDVYIGGNTTLEGDLQVQGSVTVDHSLYVQGNTTLQQDLFVTGDTTLYSSLFVSGNTVLQQDLLVQGGVTIEQGLLVQGDSTLSGELLVEGDVALAQDLHVSGNTTLAGDLLVLGDTTLAGGIFISGDVQLNNLAVSGSATLAQLKVLGDSTLCGDVRVRGSVSIDTDLTVSGHSQLNNLSVSGGATLTSMKVLQDVLVCGNLAVSGSAEVDTDLQVGGDSTLAGNLFVSGGSTLQGHVKVIGTASLCGDTQVLELLTAERLKVLGNATLCADVWVQGSQHVNRIVPFSGVTVSIGDVPGSGAQPVLATNILAVREIRGVGIGAPVTIATSVNVLGRVTATEAVITPHFCASTTIGTGDSLINVNRIQPKTGGTIAVGGPGLTTVFNADVQVRGTLEASQINPLAPATLMILGEPGDVICIDADKLQAKAIMNKPGSTLSFCAQKLLTDKIVAKSGGSLTLINPFAGQNIEVRYTGDHGNLVMGALSNVARGGRSGVFAGTGLTATGQDSVVLGGTASRAHGVGSAVVGGEDLKARGNRSVALGGLNNLLTNSIEPFEFDSRDSGILAGRGHTITAEMAVILGGCNSRVDSAKGAILGGNNIRLCGFADAAVGGGTLYSDSRNAALVGGTSNTLFGANNSVIAGGSYNRCSGMTNNMAILGGQYNRVTGDRASTVGGLSLVARGGDSVCAGGAYNRIRNLRTRSFIGGGMSLENFANDTAMAGGLLNVAEGDRGFMGGGQSNTLLGLDGAIMGGRLVRVGGQRCGGVGGDCNTIAGLNCVMIGGRDSRLSQQANHSAMAGGTQNKLFRGENSFIGGGSLHSVTNNGGHNTIIGGQDITIDSTHSGAVAGLSNYVSGTRGFVAGGENLKLHSGSDSALVAGFGSKLYSNNSIVLAGNSHTMEGINACIVAGREQLVEQNRGGILAGYRNKVLGTAFTNGAVVGGQDCKAWNTDALVAGSRSCTASGPNSSVIGSVTCCAETTGAGIYNSSNCRNINAPWSVLMAAQDSVINTSSNFGNNVLAGACDSRIQSSSRKSVIVGGMDHTLNNSLQCAIIGGQRTQMRGLSNVVLGGQDCRIHSSQVEVSAIVAGRRNRISNDQEESAIVVGRDCTIVDNSRTNYIAGVQQGIIRLQSLRSGIMSGLRQTILASENSAIIAGKDNVIDSSANTVILGGCNQTVEETQLVTMIGGLNNSVSGGVANSGNSIVASRDSSIVGEGTGLHILASSNGDIQGDSSENVRIFGTNAVVTDSQEVINIGLNHTVENAYNVITIGSNMTVNEFSQNVFVLGDNIVVDRRSTNVVGAGTDITYINEVNNATAFGQNIVIDGVSNVFALNANPTQTLVIDRENFVHISAGCDGVMHYTGLSHFMACPPNDDGCVWDEESFVMRIGGGDYSNANGLAIQVDSDDPGEDNVFVGFFDSDEDVVGQITGQTLGELLLDPVYVEYIVEQALWIALATLQLRYTMCADSCTSMDPCIALCEAQFGTPATVLSAIATEAFVLFWLIYLQDTRGVSYSSGACDYAEYVPKLDPTETILPGSVVGIHQGRVTKKITLCSGCQYFITSTSPIVVGNEPASEEERNRSILIAMLGQARTRVRGEAQVGDYLVASLMDDGVGTAVHPDDITTAQLQRVVGVIWGVDSKAFGYTTVNVAIGINQNHTAQHIQRLERRLTALEQKMDALLSGQPVPQVRSRDVDTPDSEPEPEPEPELADPTADNGEPMDIDLASLGESLIQETLPQLQDTWFQSLDKTREQLELEKPHVLEKYQRLDERRGGYETYQSLMDIGDARATAFDKLMQHAMPKLRSRLTDALPRKLQELLQQ